MDAQISIIAQSCNIARTTVTEYLRRARDVSLRWPLDPVLDDTALENLLFPVGEAASDSQRHMPSMDYLFLELKRPAVTLQLLWYEYKQANLEGHQYSQFCNLYRQWVKRPDVTLRQQHGAGGKLFVGRPRDKAKMESAVLAAERWILAALRNHTFFSLGELNRARSSIGLYTMDIRST